MVAFVEDVITDAVPEIPVCGVAAVDRISDNQVCVTYYRCRNGERQAVLRLIWDRAQWLRQWDAWDTMRRMLSDEAFELVPAHDPRKEMH